jgi:hypothetical protein
LIGYTKPHCRPAFPTCRTPFREQKKRLILFRVHQTFFGLWMATGHLHIQFKQKEMEEEEIHFVILNQQVCANL